MSNFSIDESVQLIKNSYTQDLFKEVHSSYVIGNYRSAVVMLWSVVVTDLVLKLKDLDSIYNDKTAQKILKKIEEQLEKNKTSSAWEYELVEDFFKEFNFFGTPELEQFRHLQKMRHVCAHPVINEENLLYKPTKAKVYSLIEISMQSVFLRDALISSKAIDHVLKELNRIRSIINGKKERQLYFKNKLLPLMSDNILKKFIEKLWVFSFVKNDEIFLLNLEINTHILSFLADEKKEIFIDFLKKEIKNIAKVPEDEIYLDYYIGFWATHKFLLKHMDENFKKIIISLVDSPAYKHFEFLKYSSMYDFISSFTKGEFENVYLDCMELYELQCEEEMIREKYNIFCIDVMLEIGPSFERDYFFKERILSSINKFNLADLRYLLKGMNDNKLIFQSIEKLIGEILEIDKNFDFSEFEFYQYSINSHLTKLDQSNNSDLPF
ncbi:hypothetical protein KW868_00620 [Acinetobacter guillouiae]|uniref:Uncharacterized protein n=1 Tax=Acinetobacter guillouiae TaxID=106649 RepID=A0A8X8GHV8_ACIGI|nr:hypothetical protein [Acinetobacter guillouiae]MCF0262978.1 hypothetical protein [Acinetobacter guillouiae]